MIVTITSRQTKNGNIKITSVKLRCDGCGIEYESNRRTRDVKRATHWCSRKCIGVGMQTGGQIHSAAEQTWLTHWGTTSPSQHPDVEAKRKATCLERFGTVSPMQVEEHKNLRRHNNVIKYGVENVAQLSTTIHKMHQTNINITTHI